MPGARGVACRIHLRPRQPGPEAWLPQWFDGAPDPGSATGVVLPAGGGTARITVAVKAGGEIRGRVRGNRPDGAVGSASIFVTPADADSIWGCMTDSDDGGAPWDSAAEIAIRDHAAAEGIEIEVDP